MQPAYEQLVLAAIHIMTRIVPHGLTGLATHGPIDVDLRHGPAFKCSPCASPRVVSGKPVIPGHEKLRPGPTTTLTANCPRNPFSQAQWPLWNDSRGHILPMDCSGEPKSSVGTVSSPLRRRARLC